MGKIKIKRKVRKKDSITGRELKGREGCLPFNREKANPDEMDAYFMEE